MSVDLVFSNTLRSFRDDFVIRTPTSELPLVGEPTCLADYIEAWVVSGRAARACQGSFERYLVGVVAIINLWIERPDHAINYVEYLDVDEDAEEDVRVVERRVSKLFRDDDQHKLILDRDFFEFWAFRSLNPTLKVIVSNMD